MKGKTFHTCVDDDCIEILDWIHNLFVDGRWDKHYEVTVTAREFDYGEDGERIYNDQTNTKLNTRRDEQ